MMTTSLRNKSEVKTSSYLRGMAIEWLVLISALLIFLFFIIFTLSSQYNYVTEQEKNQLTTQVEIIERTLSDRLISVRNAHINVSNELLDGQVYNEDRSLYVRKRLRGFAESISSVGVMKVLDKDGRVIESSDTDYIGQDLSGRDYFKDTKDTSIDTLHINQVFDSNADSWTIAASTKLHDLQGRFNGVIVTVFAPATISQLLRSVLYAPDERASLALADGVLFLLEPKLASEEVYASPGRDSFYTAHI